eukprot:1161613-Pelagomonas_calceolata.AAC.6
MFGPGFQLLGARTGALSSSSRADVPRKTDSNERVVISHVHTGANIDTERANTDSHMHLVPALDTRTCSSEEHFAMAASWACTPSAARTNAMGCPGVRRWQRAWRAMTQGIGSAGAALPVPDGAPHCAASVLADSLLAAPLFLVPLRFAVPLFAAPGFAWGRGSSASQTWTELGPMLAAACRAPKCAGCCCGVAGLNRAAMPSSLCARVPGECVSSTGTRSTRSSTCSKAFKCSHYCQQAFLVLADAQQAH